MTAGDSGAVPARVGMLSSLRNRNYRLYLMGQGLSHTGTWIQVTAELWLLFEITGSGASLGLHSVMRFGPMFLLGPYGGLLGDRRDRRKLLIASQTTLGVAAATLAIVSWRTQPTVLLVYTIALVQGIVNAVDNPLRRTIIRDLTTDAELANAVSLHGSVATVARAVGPAVAGLIIAGAGIRWCFGINAISYAAVISMLLLLDTRRMRPQQFAGRAPGQLRDGFAYAWQSQPIRNALIVAFVLSTFAWNWGVLVPFYATAEFGGGASMYGLLLGLLGIGAFIGAFAMARVGIVRDRLLNQLAAGLAAALLLTAVAPWLPVAVIGLMGVGCAASALAVAAQSRIQLNVADAMTGRVLALYSVVFTGAKPLGGMIGGWLTDLGGSRLGFFCGSVAMALSVAILHVFRAPQSTAVAPNREGQDGGSGSPALSE